MSDCTDCRDGILNGQDSINGLPICNDNCGSETNCEGIQTYSDCVGINPALPCIGTDGATGLNPVSLSDVLVRIDTKLCQVSSGNCTVSVDAYDNCCGTLESKLIAGSGISITKSPSGSTVGCKTLTIAESCWSYVNNITLLNGWNQANVIFDKPQYSNIKECSVRLRGVMKKSISRSCLNPGIIGSINPLYAPIKNKIFSIVLNAVSTNDACLVHIPAILYVTPSGTLSLFANLLSLAPTVTLYLSLDNIQFELN